MINQRTPEQSTQNLRAIYKQSNANNKFPFYISLTDEPWRDFILFQVFWSLYWSLTHSFDIFAIARQSSSSFLSFFLQLLWSMKVIRSQKNLNFLSPSRNNQLKCDELLYRLTCWDFPEHFMEGVKWRIIVNNIAMLCHFQRSHNSSVYGCILTMKQCKINHLLQPLENPETLKTWSSRSSSSSTNLSPIGMCVYVYDRLKESFRII